MPCRIEDESLDTALTNSVQELREQIKHACCLADVMGCVIRALRSDDGKVINRLKHRHKMVLLGKSTKNTEPDD